jgi:hypothetical protein
MLFFKLRNSILVTPFDVRREICPVVNVQKTKCRPVFISRHRPTGQNQYIKVANKSYENLSKFKYSGMTVTAQNCIHPEIMSRLNSGKT